MVVVMSEAVLVWGSFCSRQQVPNVRQTARREALPGFPCFVVSRKLLNYCQACLICNKKLNYGSGYFNIVITLCLRLSTGIFSSGSFLVQFGLRFSCAQCVLHSTAHHIRFHLIILIIINEKYELQIALSVRNSTTIVGSILTRGLYTWLLLVSVCASLC